MQQVRSAVIAARELAAVFIHFRRERRGNILRKLRGKMHDQLVLPPGIQYGHLGTTLGQPTLVTDLAAALGIEGRAVQHHLVAVTCLVLHLAIAQDLGLGSKFIIADEFGGAFRQFRPIPRGDGGGRT